MRKRAAVPWRIHLQKQNQKLLLTLATVLNGSRSTAAKNKVAAIVQCFISLGSWSCAPTELLYLSSRRKDKQKWSIFQLEGQSVQKSYKCCSKPDSFSSLLFPNQSTSYLNRHAERGYSETSEKYQKTWISWNPETDPFKMSAKILQYAEQAQLSPDCWMSIIKVPQGLTSSSQPWAASLIVDFSADPMFINVRN